MYIRAKIGNNYAKRNGLLPETSRLPGVVTGAQRSPETFFSALHRPC